MHRVVVPSGTYARARGRHCVAFFCHPDKDAVIPVMSRVAPAPAPPVFTPHTHLTLHHRLLNAAHHIQKRFKETYAWLVLDNGKDTYKNLARRHAAP